jgi:hypothetical protein
MEKHCTTRCQATEGAVRQRHPDGVPVPGSEEVLSVAENPLVNSAAHIQKSVEL